MRQYTKYISVSIILPLVVFLFTMFTESLNATSFSDINLLVDENIAPPIRKLVRRYVNSNYVSVAVQLSQYNSMLNLNTKNTDIIITADDQTILFLQNNNLVENNISYVSDVQLIFVSNYLQYDPDIDFADFVRELSDRTAIVISDPNTTLSGYVGKQLLKRLGIENLIIVKDTQKVIELVNKGGGIGLLPTSSEHNFKFVSAVPSALYQAMEYRALVLKGRYSENVASFLKFILLNEGILKEYSRL